MAYPLSLVGILVPLGDKPGGVIKRGFDVKFQDFQVREFWEDGVPLEPEFENRITWPSGDEDEHVWMKMSKRGTPTKGAIQRLSRLTGISEGEISSAGLKDSWAITAQMISIPSEFLQQIIQVDLSGEKFFLQDLHYNEVACRISSHSGNHFRITVWPAEGKFSSDQLKMIQSDLREIDELGYLNWFHRQRFGFRGVAHRVGAAMIAGNWLEAMRVILFSPIKYEDEDKAQVRRLAHEAETFTEKIDIMKSCSKSYFGQELDYLEKLARGETVRDILLDEVDNRFSFMISAWGSWLWNMAVSNYVILGWDLPKVIPQLVGIPSRKHWEEARPYYEAVGIHLPPYPEHCAQPGKAHLSRRPTRVQVDGLSARLSASKCQLEFKLRTGAYATSLLSNAFNLTDQ